ncbi:hypothetical protein ACYCFK_09405 [Stutzerimonas stutzeri]
MGLFASLQTSIANLAEAKHAPRSGTPSLNTRIAAFLFRGKRADYYQYLADMIDGTKGRMSIRDIFASDAERYGNNVRGQLSEHWARQFEEGGSLGQAFAGTLPKQDVAIFDALQAAGGVDALEEGLRDLASNTALVDKARAMMFTTMAASLVCVALVLVLVFAMPIYTVPKIAAAFSMLPAEDYPLQAVALFEFAAFIDRHWPMLTALAIAVAIALTLSLSTVTGRIRPYLDRYGVIWGLYRDFQGIRFICNLAAMVKRRGNTSRGLREAVAMQMPGASRWKAAHIAQMIDMIDHGVVGAPLFKTGMLDQTTAWYLEDLIESRGLEDALHFVRTRIESRTLQKISVQTALLSWLLILSAIAVAGYLLFWHLIVIDDMRVALQTFLS